MDLMMALLNDMLFSAIPAVGFALVFNVPTKYLPYCAIGGALGHGLRMLLIHYGLLIEWGTFAAAFTVGSLGIVLSKRLHVSSAIFTVAAMIPMVPGVYVYKAIIALVEINHIGYSPELWALFIENFLRGISIIAGLAFGLALPVLLFQRRQVSH